MRNKVSVAFLCVILIFAFLSTSVFARDDYKERTTYKLNRGPKYMIPFERANGAQVLDHKDDVSLALLGKMPTTSPGVQAGLTTYDYQHNGTMGRQIETFPGVSYVHFVWMAMSTYTFPGDRGIKYQCYNADPAVMDYTQDAGGKWGTTDYSGYTSAAALPDGRAIFGCHADYDGNDIYLSMAYTDAPGFPGWALFTGEVARPDTGASWYVTDEEIIWPIMARHNAGGNTTSDVLYMLSHVNEANEDMILYRKVGTANFDGGQKIETITDLSYTIVADPYSNNVYIVYTDDRVGMDEGDGGQDDLDVWYKKSTDQGVTWGAAIDVSNYTGDSLWRAYDDLSAVISPDGNLHIIWPARQLNDSNTYENAKCRLVHWSTDIPQARILSEARYTMEERCDPGAWNMYIAKPSISWCDDRLYALWTQFGHARETGAKGDCSQAGFANGELYLAVSNDNGFTWDLPANLTQSRTPRCDSAECDSDHWSSMTSYGMVYDGAADTLDIQYVNDKDAGGLPQGEGSRCVNPIMHLRIPCRDIIPT
ncbi:MAG: sialidase family protein, partial [candidate division Zixibacteria bacterium]|nr:sialidase family protein [candidate division Zixibacteria bacterium]